MGGGDAGGKKIVPTDNDVLCGRGGSINTHPGNETFRKFVDRRKRVYLTARFKREKRLIAEAIVKEIRSLDPPGRFLTRDGKGEDWYDIGDEKARDKTSQALRENAPSIRKEIEVENDIRREQMRKEEEEASTRVVEPSPPAHHGHAHPPAASHGHAPPSAGDAWGYHPHAPPPHPGPPPHGYQGGEYSAPEDQYNQQAYPPPPHYGSYTAPPPSQPQPHPPSGNDNRSKSSAFSLPKVVTSALSSVPSTFSLGFHTTSSSSSSPPPGAALPQHLPPPHGAHPAAGPALRKPSPHYPPDGRDAQHHHEKSVHFESPPGYEARSRPAPHPYENRPYSRTINGYEDEHTAPHYGQDPRGSVVTPSASSIKQHPGQPSNPQQGQQQHHPQHPQQGQQHHPSHQQHIQLHHQQAHQHTQPHHQQVHHHPPPPPGGYYAQAQQQTAQPQPQQAGIPTATRNSFEPPPQAAHRHYSSSQHDASAAPRPVIAIPNESIMDEEEEYKEDNDDKNNGNEAFQYGIPPSPSSGTFNSILSTGTKKSRNGSISAGLSSDRPQSMSASPIPASSSHYQDDNASRSSGLFQIAQHILHSLDGSTRGEESRSTSKESSKESREMDLDNTNHTINTFQMSREEEEDMPSEEGQEVELLVVDSMDVEEDVMPPPPPPQRSHHQHQAAATLKRARDRIATRDSEVRTPPPVDADWQKQAGGCHMWLTDSIKENLPAAVFFDGEPQGRVSGGAEESTLDGAGSSASGNQSAGAGIYNPLSPGERSINSFDMDGVSLCGTEFSAFAGSVGASVGGQSLAHVFDGDNASVAAGSVPSLPEMTPSSAHSRRAAVAPAQQQAKGGGMLTSPMPPPSPMFHAGADNRSVNSRSSFGDRSLISKADSKGSGTKDAMGNLSMTYSMEAAMHQAEASVGGPESVVSGGTGGEDFVWSWDGKSHGE